MLFFLTNSLIVGANDNSYNGIFKTVQNLAIQAIDGSHVISGTYEAIAHFREVFKHDPTVGLYFNSLYQNFATLSIPNELLFYIEVVKENPVCRSEDGREICQKDYMYYQAIDSCSATRLIGEDLNDTYFFIHILNWYINQLSKNFHYHFHSLGGGGKNTYRIVQNEISARHIVICIVDTDKKYPNCPPEKNGTYDMCVNLLTNNACDYCFLPLNVHEIENIIPLNYIDLFDNWSQGNANDQRKKRAFDFLCSDKTVAEEILPYFDYKKGIKKDSLFQNNLDYQNFAKKCYEANADKINKNPSFENYVNSLQDKGEIYPNLIGGSGILVNTLELINSKKCPPPILLDFQKNNWESIGKILLSWGIARDTESIS